MRKIIATLTLIVVIALVSQSAWAKKYNVNFKNVPMKDFITFVSEFTGKNVIFNENDIRGNITVNSQKEMDDKEVLDIFYSVLKMNGYLPVVSGNNIQIIAEKDVPLFDEPMNTASKKNAESYVTSVIALKYYNAPTLVQVLNRIKSRSGYVELVRGLNILVVRDMTSRINKMMTLIDEIDREANAYKFHTIQLSYAVASKVEQQIIKLYGELGKNALTTTNPVVISDDISNSLIIAATDDEFQKVQYLVKTFDSRSNTASNAPKIYYLKNSKAEDVEKVLSKLLGSIAPTPQAGTPATNAVKANVSSDKATNSIIAVGDPELYSNLGILIEKMDVPRRQVFVEALILETSIDDGLRFGVEWMSGAGFGEGAGVIGGLNSSGALGGLLGPVIQGNAPDITAMPSGFSLGVIGNLISFNGQKFPSIGALISAVQSNSGVNIVSNPQILTLDNAEAEVFVGENRPFVTSEKFDSNNNPIQTFDYRNVGVRLKITPQISSNDMVTLTIDQEVNKLSAATFDATAPVTLTRTTKTTAKLEDKSIMLISGMIKDDTTLTESGVPFLSKIPVLGWLFKTRNRSSEKTNLMVFISAHIIDTVEDARTLLKMKQETMKQFNEEADKLFGRSFSNRDSGIEMKEKINNETNDNNSTPVAPQAVPEPEQKKQEPDKAVPLNMTPKPAEPKVEKTEPTPKTATDKKDDEVINIYMEGKPASGATEQRLPSPYDNATPVTPVTPPVADEIPQVDEQPAETDAEAR